jgi:hypothetical protein
MAREDISLPLGKMHASTLEAMISGHGQHQPLWLDSEQKVINFSEVLNGDLRTHCRRVARQLVLDAGLAIS